MELTKLSRQKILNLWKFNIIFSFFFTKTIVAQIAWKSIKEIIKGSDENEKKKFILYIKKELKNID